MLFDLCRIDNFCNLEKDIQTESGIEGRKEERLKEKRPNNNKDNKDAKEKEKSEIISAC